MAPAAHNADLPWRDDQAGGVIARLLIAAREDAAFAVHVRAILGAPTLQRRSLVNRALHQMTLHGEPEAMRAALAILATDEGAAAALAFLDSR